ncbi:hypothetical protein OSJ57_24190 [Sphingomonas sp. HH69]
MAWFYAAEWPTFAPPLTIAPTKLCYLTNACTCISAKKWHPSSGAAMCFGDLSMLSSKGRSENRSGLNSRKSSLSKMHRFGYTDGDTGGGVGLHFSVFSSPAKNDLDRGEIDLPHRSG